MWADTEFSLGTVDFSAYMEFPNGDNQEVIGKCMSRAK